MYTIFISWVKIDLSIEKEIAYMPRLKGNASDTALKKIVQKINDYELS